MDNGPLGSVLEEPRPPRTAVDTPSDRQLLDRFVKRRDEEAFAALVRRYGPLVLGVCRRVLGNAADAQDAFQVTFLVLARKADTLEKPELLANWLYGVAYRTAIKARGRAARRRECERQAAGMATPDAASPAEGREVLEVLDEELNLLPEAYRILLVLCYLEGKTHEEAAQQIGCPIGSMSWRLGRARDLLRKRLNRRGLVLPASLLALLWAQRTACAAALPSGLAETTARAAVGLVVGGGAKAAGLSASVAALTEEVLCTRPATSWWLRALPLLLAVLLALLATAVLGYHVWGNYSNHRGHCSRSGTAAVPEVNCSPQ